MGTKIAWTLSPQYSPISATAAVCSGLHVVDAQLQSLIGDSATAINDRLALADVDNELFWSALIALCEREKDDRRRVERALIASGSGELAADSIAPTIAGHLVDVRIAYFEAYPKLSEQLPLRAGPLRQQWEARGPGLLAAIGRLTHQELLPSKATVAMVQPTISGGGGADPGTGFAWIEAMLTNPHQDVPEVLRLGWLLARLGLARPAASRLVEADRLPGVASLALLPIMIEAGRELELVGDVEVSRLFEVWNLRRLKSSEAIVHLNKWWAQMEDGETPFPVGMKALDRMLNH